MIKVGIVTFHNALSYGAVLQSFALQQFIQKTGMDVDIIDYQCDYINKKYKKLVTIDSKHPVKSLIGSILRFRNKAANIKLSEEFCRHNTKLSQRCKKADIHNLVSQYDFFVAGSDQVFSPTCAGFDTTYLLDYAKPSQKFSYSASFGTTCLPKEKTEKYRELLSDFQKISVREDSGKKIIRELIGKKAEVHVDPTLLLSRSEWDYVAEESLIAKPYILVFHVLKPKRLLSCAIELGRTKNMNVYYITDKIFPKIKGVKYLTSASPAQFVGLIKGAEYIYTNSFHASVFSIIYHKKFVVELDTVQARNVRSEALLDLVGIFDREITEKTTPDPDVLIDWKSVDAVIHSEICKSQQYFENILASKMSEGDRNDYKTQ